MIYLIGSLRNPQIPLIANELRKEGWDIFDDWFSPGPTTDDEWQRHEKIRGRTFREALDGAHARDVFKFDKDFLDLSSGVILILPAGKSAHTEAGYIVGQGKPVFVLMQGEPERYDIMYRFFTSISLNMNELKKELKLWEKVTKTLL